MPSQFVADTPIAPGVQRRSDRISLAIGLEVAGADASGGRFTENLSTELVSQYGCSLVTRRRLAADSILLLKRPVSGRETRVRVVGQVGTRDHGHVYGVVFLDPPPDFWGIYSPHVVEAGDSVARVLLQCRDCRRQEVVALDRLEFSVFEANMRITHHCPQCPLGTGWQPVRAGASKSGSQNPEAPRLPRTRMRAIACITQPSGVEDLAQVLGISRGGVSFRSKCEYTVSSWIQLAVPYTPEVASIFVPGRITWHRATADNQHAYGVQYVGASRL